jgi:hydrogenase maturation protein HypF
MHLRAFKLLGGDKAIKEPRRVALALLFECFSLDEILALKLPTIQSFSSAEITTLHKMYSEEINTPQTSSIGRLFDAIASLSDLAQTLSYEGQSGLLIEAAAKKYPSHQHFDYVINEETIDWEPMLRELLTLNAQEIPTLFMQMLVKIIIDIAQRYPHLPIVLSGGVFQNRYLLDLLIPQLKQSKMRYYIQQETPINDGGIALGQIFHALHRFQDEA